MANPVVTLLVPGLAATTLHMLPTPVEDFSSEHLLGREHPSHHVFIFNEDVPSGLHYKIESLDVGR